MKIEAIIACGGKGNRLKNRLAKPLVSLNGIPIFVRTIKAVSNSRLIEKIILVVKKEEMARFASLAGEYKLKKVKAVISGGKTRSHSISNGLKFLDKNTELVVIHDGVRPFISRQLIDRTIRAAVKCGAAILAVPAKATIKQVSGRNLMVEKTLDRGRLWEVQTPQVFKKEIILKAYKKFNRYFTDDAALVEQIKKPVKVVMGAYQNIKITTPEDLVFARAILK